MPIYVGNFTETIKGVDDVLFKDYGHRLRDVEYKGDTRPLLSPMRSLGSVVKLLGPDYTDFTDEYNAWVEAIPAEIKSFVFLVKRHYRPEWGRDWQSHFGVDFINGQQGHEILFDGHTLAATHARIGLYGNNTWRAFKVRQDFHSSWKIQLEDDITASIVVPVDVVKHCGSPAAIEHGSVKLLSNVEYRFFQRPDDAIIRGHDKHAEEDLSRMDGQLFCSNYQPLTQADALENYEDSVDLFNYTQPMVDLITTMAGPDAGAATWICSDKPRIVNGAPSKNVRYLENRQSMTTKLPRYLTEIAARLYRKVPVNCPVHFPVAAVLPGRRLNKVDPERGIPGLAVYSPLHYQELPELLMDLVTCLTGASPSTTGFGTEGALTKAPFNCLQATADLNNALVSLILTGHGVFSSAAGFVGPQLRVDHDFSLMMPELFCRMTEQERDPAYLIANGFLEKLDDFEHDGAAVQASRLGFRITMKFIAHFFGRIFDTPTAIFDETHLRPEEQGLDVFCDGIAAIVDAQKTSALRYFADGAIHNACPPLAAVLHCMAHGEYQGKPISHPEIRALFTREALVTSGWYLARLRTQQGRETKLAHRFVEYLTQFQEKKQTTGAGASVNVQDRLVCALKRLEKVQGEGYITKLQGTIGADPISQF